MSIQNRVRDGHIHTPFCPHGSQDPLGDYVEKAKAIGLEAMSFTEHMPLPEGVLPEVIAKQCSPSQEVILDYFKAVEVVKKQYETEIVIATGLEVDYIEGYEQQTKRMLNVYGPYIQDSLLSVHILKVGEKHICFDEISGFEEVVKQLGSVEAVYDLYYETLIKGVVADLGPYKPQRLAHLSLPRVFQKKYPLDYANDILLERLVTAIQSQGLMIEFNTGGLRKTMCEEIYPSGRLKELVEKYEIPFIWGSDAHRAEDVGFGFGAY